MSKLSYHDIVKNHLRIATDININKKVNESLNNLARQICKNKKKMGIIDIITIKVKQFLRKNLC